MDPAIYSDGSAKTDSDEDISSLKPYQFEPSTELVNNSSEESCEEDEAENDERLTNTEWQVDTELMTPVWIIFFYIGVIVVTVK